MNDAENSEEFDGADAYWLVRVRPADGMIGYVAEVYNEVPLSVEITDPNLAPVEDEWLRMNVYRSQQVYATKAGARDAADRLRQFLDYVHLRG